LIQVIRTGTIFKAIRFCIEIIGHQQPSFPYHGFSARSAKTRYQEASSRNLLLPLRVCADSAFIAKPSAWRRLRNPLTR
jgi:hypothetical protein